MYLFIIQQLLKNDFMKKGLYNRLLTSRSTSKFTPSQMTLSSEMLGDAYLKQNSEINIFRYGKVASNGHGIKFWTLDHI